jgi:hypothetical protein
MTGSKWFTCDQCGRDYPVKYLRKQQGKSVCTFLPCFDKILTQDDPLSDLAEIDLEIDLEVLNDGF